MRVEQTIIRIVFNLCPVNVIQNASQEQRIVPVIAHTRPHLSNEFVLFESLVLDHISMRLGPILLGWSLLLLLFLLNYNHRRISLTNSK